MKRTHTRELCLTALGTAFLCLCGVLSFPLPPVAVSAQSLGVFTIAGLLGPLWGTLSVFLYLTLGALGVPVFSGFGGGFAVLAGPSGGFLLSFLPAALLVGLAAKTKKRAPLIASLALSHLLIYMIGSLWYACLYAKGASLLAVLAVSVLPFLAGDAVKAVLAYFLIRRLQGKLT